MEINYFDIGVAAIVLLLGLKGIINGFFKELFGLIGIIGGIFVASRMGDSVGAYLNDLIFHFSSEGAVNFTGFLVTLALFWLVMVIAGYAFKRLSAMSGLGIVDRILGFVFGASKFFLIASVILFAFHNSKTLKSTVDSLFENSQLFPIMVETGAFIMKLDTEGVTDKVSESLESSVESVKDKAVEATKEEIQKEIDTIKENTQDEK
jgi:membrane protein required for colicin V production